MIELGEKIVAEAFAAFDWWCQKHDPEGEMNIEQQVNAYGEWCDAGNRAPVSSPDRQGET